MATRGRKSAAALSVVAGSIDGRPKPLAGLTKFQKAVWDKTVASEAAAFFETAALQQLLAEYCRHCEASNILAKQINEFDPAWLVDEDGLRRYERLLSLRDKETKALADKATKLRLTNQSRYTPQAASTASRRNDGSKAKPWEFTG